MYGHQHEHANIRSRVIDYMREHADYYKQFIDVHPGGGIRRNPKRKNAGAYSSTSNFVPPSEADIDRVFESHLQSMSKGGTYGDNMEITAFSSAFDYDVKIYQRDFAYMVSGSGVEDTGRPVAHIAYHMWEHYSSIRNLDGPHTGMPTVNPHLLSPEEERNQQEKLAQTPHVLPWMVDVVAKSLPFLADKPAIKRAIEATKGNIDLAVSNLMDAEENGSGSSQHESSSVERDHDSDDEAHDGPNKKQDRRMSRASKHRQHRSAHSRHALSHLTVEDGSQESFTSWESETSSQPDSSLPNSLPSSFDSREPFVKREEPASDPGQPKPVSRPPIRIKLLPPRPPEQLQRAGKTTQKQSGPKVSARDRKDIKKQAQKAARKERQQAAVKGNHGSQSPSQIGITLRAKGMTETPPVDTLRTLYI